MRVFVHFGVAEALPLVQQAEAALDAPGSSAKPQPALCPEAETIAAMVPKVLDKKEFNELKVWNSFPHEAHSHASHEAVTAALPSCQRPLR